MTLVFTTTDVAAREHGVKICTHGRGGVGKTTLVRTLHEWESTGPCVLLSAESGVLPLGDIAIPQITITDYKQMEEAYNWIAFSEHARQFKSVALDSISEIAEKCLIGEKISKKDGRAAYGEMGDQMRELIRKFRDLPGRHVYFSAKQSFNKDEVTGVTRYGPSMPGQALTKDMPYFFDELFSMEIGVIPETGVEYRYLLTRLGLQHEAKDRSGALADMEEPHLGKIIDKIMAHLARNLQGV